MKHLFVYSSLSYPLHSIYRSNLNKKSVKMKNVFLNGKKKKIRETLENTKEIEGNFHEKRRNYKRKVVYKG